MIMNRGVITLSLLLLLLFDDDDDDQAVDWASPVHTSSSVVIKRKCKHLNQFK